jgi:ketosteroid isomerase-like protein
MSAELSQEEKTALDVVKKMYAAFDKGDLNTVLELQSDDVVWHVGQGDKGTRTSPDPGLPFAGTFDTWLVHKCIVRNGKITYLWNHIDTGPIWAAFGKK